MAATANPAGASDRRILSTPYARRLARERSLTLSAVVGTGPRGQVTGADVLAFTPKPAAPQSAAIPVAVASHPRPTSPWRRPRIAADVDLAASRQLLVQFADLAPSIGLIDIILKSAAASLRTAPDLATEAGQAVLGLAKGGTVLSLAGVERLTLGAVAALRNHAGPADRGAALTISWIERDSLRPIATMLDSGAVARLVIAAGPTSIRAECLLSYDPRRMDDGVAADLLLAFKGAMEFPLRLIA